MSLRGLAYTTPAGHTCINWTQPKVWPGQAFLGTELIPLPTRLRRLVAANMTQDNPPPVISFQSSVSPKMHNSRTERRVFGQLLYRRDLSTAALLGTGALLAVEYSSFENRSKGGVFILCHMLYLHLLWPVQRHRQGS